MYVREKQVRLTLDRARKAYADLSAEEQVKDNAKRWFNETEQYALAGQKYQALWCLCMASCILFSEEIKRSKARKDIIIQIAHQFQAYGTTDN